MKFLRHFTAVVLVVAVIVGLGMIWAHASGGPGPGQAPSHEALRRLEQIKTGAIRVHPDNGFHLANTGNLIRTCEIEAALAAVVITAGVIRRRRRRMRRTAARRRGAEVGAIPGDGRTVESWRSGCSASSKR